MHTDLVSSPRRSNGDGLEQATQAQAALVALSDGGAAPSASDGGGGGDNTPAERVVRSTERSILYSTLRYNAAIVSRHTLKADRDDAEATALDASAAAPPPRGASLALAAGALDAAAETARGRAASAVASSAKVIEKSLLAIANIRGKLPGGGGSGGGGAAGDGSGGGGGGGALRALMGTTDRAAAAQLSALQGDWSLRHADLLGRAVSRHRGGGGSDGGASDLAARRARLLADADAALRDGAEADRGGGARRGDGAASEQLAQVTCAVVSFCHAPARPAGDVTPPHRGQTGPAETVCAQRTAPRNVQPPARESVRVSAPRRAGGSWESC